MATTNATKNISGSYVAQYTNATSSYVNYCCVPGNRKINIYDKESSKRGELITLEDLEKNFRECFTDSINNKIEQQSRKKIAKVTKAKFTGFMFRFVFDFENEIYFECTDSHELPIFYENEEMFIGYPENLCLDAKLFQFVNGEVVKVQPKAIITYQVKDVDVYNLVLESESNREGKYYIDAETGIIHKTLR